MKKVILSSMLLAVLLTAFSFDMNAAQQADARQARPDALYLSEPSVSSMIHHMFVNIEDGISSLQTEINQLKTLVKRLEKQSAKFLGRDQNSRTPLNLSTKIRAKITPDQEVGLTPAQKANLDASKAS